MNIPLFPMGIWGEKDPKGMPSHLFFGSRRLDYSTAQRADISKQNFSVCPRHWYVDATFVCRDCNGEFIFFASEQRFWYEDRHFWIDSLPTRCISCRKEQRTRLNLRKRYDALIATALGACPAETKKEIVAIINELEAAEDDIPEKMKQSRSVLYAQLAKAAS
ncbi:MAG: hypothetical protein K0Q55_3763 [Verrucomicrobia bacterium]|jgi:hypothetical protein|nr:hypothetical protein [Verrucomicrobiota bacterium]